MCEKLCGKLETESSTCAGDEVGDSGHVGVVRVRRGAEEKRTSESEEEKGDLSLVRVFMLGCAIPKPSPKHCNIVSCQ